MVLGLRLVEDDNDHRGDDYDMREVVRETFQREHGGGIFNTVMTATDGLPTTASYLGGVQVEDKVE